MSVRVTESYFDLQQPMVVFNCTECFMPFALPAEAAEALPHDHLFCPVGHTQASPEENEKPAAPANPLVDSKPVPPPNPDGAAFIEFCNNHGFDPVTHYRGSQTIADLVSQPEDELVDVQLSGIHGFGVFTQTEVPAGESAGTILDQGLHRTDKIGRFINHAAEPNCQFMCDMPPDETGVRLMAVRDIEAGEELTIDYAEALELKKKLAP